MSSAIFIRESPPLERGHDIDICSREYTIRPDQYSDDPDLRELWVILNRIMNSTIPYNRKVNFTELGPITFKKGWRVKAGDAFNDSVLNADYRAPDYDRCVSVNQPQQKLRDY